MTKYGTPSSGSLSSSCALLSSDDNSLIGKIGTSSPDNELYVDYYQRVIADQDMLRPFNIHKQVLFISYLVIMALLGSIAYNWPPMRDALIKDGAYVWLCEEMKPTETGANCPEQDNAINGIYAVAMPCIYMAALVSGIILDYVGTRMCFLFGVVTQTLGMVCWAGASENVSWLYKMGGFLIGISNEACFAPFYSVCYLFPDKSYAFMGLIGMIRSFVFAKSNVVEAQTDLYGLRGALWTWIGIVCLVGGIGLLLLPKRNFPKILKNDGKWQYTTPNTEEVSLKEHFLNMLHVLKRPDVIVLLLYVPLNSVRLSTIVVTNPFFLDLKNTKGLSTTFNWMIPMSGLLTIFFGHLGDKLHLLVICAIINTAYMLMYLAQLIVPGNVAMDWVTTICVMIGQSWTAMQVYSLVTKNYHHKHFGVICGATGAIQACFLTVVPAIHDYMSGAGDEESIGQASRTTVVLWSLTALAIPGYVMIYLYHILQNRYAKMDNMEKDMEEKWTTAAARGEFTHTASSSQART